MTVDPQSWQVSTRDFLGRECSPLTPSGCMQRHANEGVMRIARLLNLPLLTTLDSHYILPESKLIQDIGLDNSTGGNLRFSGVYCMMDTGEAWDKWTLLHGDDEPSRLAFSAGVENNHLLASLTEPVTFEQSFHLPPVDVPVDIQSRAASEEDGWERLVMRRINEYGRFPGVGDARRGQYAARLNEELGVIARNGTINFLPYFIALHDVCRYARDNDVLCGPGRGSAAGSLLSYLLMITHLDPIEYNLSFARFLSMGRIARGKFPDIDLDFGDPEFIAAHLRELHGDRFVRVSTTGTLKPKSAIKDVARVLLDTRNHPAVAEEVEAVTKSMPNVPQGMENLLGWMYGYEDNTGAFPGQVAENPLLAEFLEKYPAVREAVDALVGLPKSLGRHASGFVLADVPVGEIVPTCIIGKKNDQEVCTQFTKDDVEKLGLVKMDILGLNTLKDIRGAIDLIATRGGPAIDIYTLPTDDTATFDAFCAGANETVFQFNSDIATNLCRQVKPRSIDDLSQITANGRPGTMYAVLEDGKTTLIDAWVSRRQGHSPVTFLHPDLEEITHDTQAIFVFQEQVSAAFQKCCGFSEERADEIREIVGKKKLDQMEKILPEIREQLQAHGWNDRQSDSFVSLCIAASSYSFNRCVTGDTVVYRAGLGSHCKKYEISLKELYETWHSNTPVGQKYRGGAALSIRMLKEGRIKTGRIEKIYKNGVKPIVKVTLENGMFIKTTENHRHMTNIGWREAGQLKVGEQVMVQAGSEPIESQKKESGKGWAGKTLIRKRASDGRMRPSLGGHSAKLKQVIAQLPNYCERCGKTEGRLEAAHLNHDRTDNTRKNVKRLCNSCHKQHDLDTKRRKRRFQKGHAIAFFPVVSVTPAGEEEVYDLEMEDPEHCYVANGIVTHNSHSAAYAYLGYVCQFLKTHHPLEWWTSVLQNSKADDLELNARHCRDFLLPPDVNHSDLDFYILDGAREKIVYPLSRVKGVKAAGSHIITRRPFASLEDFLTRVPHTKAMLEEEGLSTGMVNKGVVATLIWSGAFDQLCGVKTPMDRVDVYRRFLDFRDIRNKPRRLEDAALPKDEFEVLMRQNCSLPLNAADFSGLISKRTSISIIDPERLDAAPAGKYVRVAGYVQSVRLTKVKKVGSASFGKNMAFVDLVNRSRVISVTVFSEAYETHHDILKEGKVLLVGGKIDDWGGRRKIVAEQLKAFGEAILDPEEMAEAEREKLEKLKPKPKNPNPDNEIENDDSKTTSGAAEYPHA